MTGGSKSLRRIFLLAARCLTVSLFIACLITGIFDQTVYATAEQNSTEDGSFLIDVDDALSELDLSDLEQFVSDNLSNTQMGFGELIRKLIHADESLSFSQIAADLLSILFGEIQQNRAQAVQILLLVICSAVLSSIASVFDSDQIAGQAWFVVFLMIMASALTGFIQSCRLVTDCLNLMIAFMKMLLPAFCLSMVCITGAASSSLYYQATFGIIGLVDAVLIYAILPFVKLYFGVSVLNGLTGGERFAGIEELIKVLYEWSMKTLCAVIVGLQVIQGLIVPLASSAGPAFAQKLIGSIPGIGSGIKSTAEILIGTGTLIKNGIGMAGCVVLVLVSLYPILQMAAIVLIYYGIAAIASPISDKRMITALQAVSFTNRMMLKTLCMAVFLFLITIAVICAFTNRVL